MNDPSRARPSRLLLRPGWMIFSAVAVLLLAVFAALGMWQLRRLEERRFDNRITAARLEREPLPLADFLAVPGVTEDPGHYRYTAVSAAGVFLEEGAVEVRSQVHQGVDGVHIVHPFLLDDGRAALVNIGWFPSGAARPPAAGIYGAGRVEITGLVRPSQPRPALGRTEPEGELRRVSRIDVPRLAQQVGPPLLPFWIQLTAPDDPQAPPVPVPLPDLGDGPHLPYAIQWFSFGAVLAGGYAALLRRDLKRLRRREEAGDGPGPPLSG